jgi:hypothetical protein
MKKPIHTSDVRRFRHLWVLLGGWVEPIRRTGELHYGHASLVHPIRANGRRDDVPAVLLSKLNQLIRLAAANDHEWGGVNKLLEGK